MDNQKLADLLRGTIDPNQREEAEKHLEQVTSFIHTRADPCHGMLAAMLYDQ